MMGALILLTPVWRWVAGFGLAVAIIAGAYGLGHHKGAVAEAAKWQAREAAEVTRQAAARAKALDEAVARELVRTKENQILQQEVSDYEQKLAAEPVDPPQPSPVAGALAVPAACHRLSADDVRELRQLQGRGGPP
jgi:hypothetical protein